MWKLVSLAIVTGAIGCGESSGDDGAACTPGGDMKVQIAPIHDASADVTASGSFTLPDDATIEHIEVGVVAEPFDPSLVVFSIPATISGTTWTATVPIADLLAPNQGQGLVVVAVRATSNCVDRLVGHTPAFTVTPESMVDSVIGGL